VTGPEHYRKAEQWLGDAAEAVSPDADMGYLAWKVSVAQVHATLALAAATGLGMDQQPHVDTDAWCEAAGTAKQVREAPSDRSWMEMNRGD
jgi:hypothetical protein